MAAWFADNLGRVEHTWLVIFLLGNQEIMGHGGGGKERTVNRLLFGLLSNAFSCALIIVVLAGKSVSPQRTGIPSRIPSISIFMPFVPGGVLGLWEAPNKMCWINYLETHQKCEYISWQLRLKSCSLRSTPPAHSFLNIFCMLFTGEKGYIFFCL